MSRTIVVGVDRSPSSAAALRWAHAEARRRGGRVLALYAWGFARPGHAGGEHTFDPGYTTARASAELAAFVEQALGTDAAAGIDQRASYAYPPTALLSAADIGDLLVVGTRGVGGLRGLRLGSVSRFMLHHTRKPLAVVPPIERPTTGRIVAGFDGSESARRALAWAAEEARLREARLDVVQAWQVPYPVAAPMAGYPVVADALAETARAGIDEALAIPGLGDLAVPATPCVVQGPAGPAILDAAEGADLIVLGTRGHGTVAGALLGSVTHHVVHHATRPVAVVP
ncbi:MAG TPA: universal stress protein [Acidimicrobiales bacterium]